MSLNSNVYGGGNKKIDFPCKVENNIHFLYPFPVHLFRFGRTLLIHHFMESHDVIKEKAGHVKYPAPYDLLQHLLVDKISRTAFRIALVFCTQA